MALVMTAKIGDIEGESAIDGHVGEIDVLSFSFGGSHSGTMHTGTGGGAGKTSVQDLTLMKRVDLATTDLMLACFKRTHISEAVLTVRKAAGNRPLDYLKITMTSCLITSVSTGGSGDDDRLTENIAINFAKVRVDYDAQTAAGGQGAHSAMEYDITANGQA
jgi:type VI secretion system secreted protein Hcp